MQTHDPVTSDARHGRHAPRGNPQAVYTQLPVEAGLWFWELESFGRSPDTLRFYRGCLVNFHLFAGLEVLRGDRVKARHAIKAWVADMMARHNSPSSVATRFRGLRAYCGWLKHEEYIDRSPMEGMRTPIVPRKLRETYSEHDVRNMLALCPSNRWWGARDRLVVVLAVQGGLRRAEIAGVNMADILWDKNLLRVKGKGQKWRVVDITEPMRLAIKSWNRFRVPSEPALVQSNVRTRMTPEGIGQVMYELGKRAGIEGKRGPHRGRHTFVTEKLREGADIYDVQKAAGHASVATTEGYNQEVTAETRVQNLHKFNKTDRWFAG